MQADDRTERSDRLIPRSGMLRPTDAAQRPGNRYIVDTDELGRAATRACFSGCSGR